MPAFMPIRMNYILAEIWNLLDEDGERHFPMFSDKFKTL